MNKMHGYTVGSLVFCFLKAAREELLGFYNLKPSFGKNIFLFLLVGILISDLSACVNRGSYTQE